MDVTKQLARADHEPGHHLARQQRLARVVDDPCLDHLHHAIRKQLRMDTQVPVVGQSAQHGIRNTADPHLKCRPIGNQRCDVIGNAILYFGRGEGEQFRQLVIHLDEMIDLAHVDEAVPQRARHIGIDLRNHHLGHFRRAFGHAHLHAIGTVPVLVRRADVYYRHIQRHPPGAE